MQIAFIFFLLSIGAFKILISQKISLSFLVEFAFASFLIRMFIALCLGLFFINLDSELVTERYGSAAAVFSLIYLFSFTVYSKVLIKSLLRSGELIARFTLDAMPGEQLAVDISKRDKVISVLEAEKRRVEMLTNSLDLANLEARLKILSYEPLMALFIIAVSVLLKLLLVNNIEGLFNANSLWNLVLQISLGATLLSGSAIFTIVPLLRAIQRLDKNTIRTYVFQEFMLELFEISWKLILFGGSVLFLIAIYLSSFVEALNSTFLVFISSIAIKLFIASKRDLRKVEVAQLISRSFSEKAPNFIRQNRIQKISDRDLKLTLRKKAILEEDKTLLWDIAVYLRDSCPQALSVERFVIEVFSGNKDEIDVEWRGQVLTFDFVRVQEMVKSEFVMSIARNLLIPNSLMLSISDVSFGLLLAGLSNAQYSYLSDLAIEEKVFIRRMLQKVTYAGVLVRNLGAFAELCLSSEGDESEVLTSFIEEESFQLRSQDGKCRVVYVSDTVDIQQSNANIFEIRDRLKERNLSPLVVVGNFENLETLDPETKKDLLFISPEAFPRNLNFFPLKKFV